MASDSQKNIKTYFRHSKNLKEDFQTKNLTKLQTKSLKNGNNRHLRLLRKIKALSNPKTKNVALKNEKRNIVETTKIDGKELLEQYRKHRSLQTVENDQQKLKIRTNPILPLSFLRLLKIFRAIENCMSLYFFRDKKLVPIDEIKLSVEFQTKKLSFPKFRNFGKIDVLRIAKVVPEAIIAKYISKKEKSDGWRMIKTLVVQLVHLFDGNSILNKSFFIDQKIRKFRERVFYERLLKIVENEHDKFLERGNFVKIDVTKYNEWHAKFPIDDIDLPEPIEVEGEPVSGNLPVIEKSHFSCLASDALKSRLSVKRISKSKKETKNVRSKIKGISQKLIDKIKRKSEMANELNKFENERKEILKISKLKEFVRSVNEFLILSKRTKISFKNLAKTLKERNLVRNFNNNFNAQSLSRTINDITKLGTGWCRKTGRNNDILEVDSNIKLKHIFDKIDSKIESIQKIMN
ncbi:hypothetical protein MHBO_001280 [Bonamia ostreae]|uniref:CDT1 Geminin-binding domain-containing protein n=1 Tax=Bonamia ostreae TaxID=126728 RepID=A0ABV2AIE9_9EUKA